MLSNGADAVNRDGITDFKWTGIVSQPPAPGSTDQGALVIMLDGAGESSWPRFRWPALDEERERELVETRTWWVVASLTGVSAWMFYDCLVPRRGAPTRYDLEVRAISRLEELLKHVRVPVRASDGSVDLHELVRRGVRAGFRQLPHSLPYLFAERPDLDVPRARLLLRSSFENGLFRFCADEHSSGILALIWRRDGRETMELLHSQAEVRGILTRALQYVGGGGTPRATYAPPYLVDDLRSYVDPLLPRLDAVVRTPVFRPDGTLLDTPGYDPKTRLYYSPELNIAPIPEVPTQADVAWARETLLRPFAEFPLRAPYDLTAIIAALLEQVVRPMIQGPRPLYLIVADEIGTGKTLIGQVIQVIIEGPSGSVVTSLGRREEETEKRVTSLLLSNRRIILIDNLVGSVRSESLMQLATAERFQSRLLGESRSPILPQNSTWIMTSNHANLAPDIARRCVLIQLRASCAQPWMRSGFAIPELLQWTSEHRGELLRALLVLARAWIAAGRPKDPELVRGSFEGWARVVGGILHHAGFASLRGAVRAADTRNVEHSEFAALMNKWHLERPGAELTAGALGELALAHGLFAGRLQGAVAAAALGKRMSHLIRSRVGRPLHGWRIVSAGRVAGCAAYRLEQVVEPPSL